MLLRAAVPLMIGTFWAFAQEAPLPDGLYAIFDTSAGSFTAKLYEKDTPQSVRTFVGLAQGTTAWRDPKSGKMVKRPLFENLLFYRVISGDMIQSGSPTGTPAWDCGIQIRDEYLPGLRFDRSGRLAMANTDRENSGGCQFFITVNAIRSWDMKYVIFGQVVRGMDVVEKINRAPVHGEEPLRPVKLGSVTITRVGPEPPIKHRR